MKSTFNDLDKDLGNFRRLGLLKGNKVCCHSYWKLVLVLVNSQNRATTV